MVTLGVPLKQLTLVVPHQQLCYQIMGNNLYTQ